MAIGRVEVLCSEGTLDEELATEGSCGDAAIARIDNVNLINSDFVNDVREMEKIGLKPQSPESSFIFKQ